MKEFVKSKKYSHIPISSLCLLAQRLEKVFCSIDTWYRYINLFGWRRPKQKNYKKKYNGGLLAKSPNEIWHIDISQFIFIAKKKFYFQAIIDNFSRYILSWQLEERVSAENPVKLIKKAKNTYKDLLGRKFSKIITDGGPENTAGIVTKYLETTNFTRLVAQQDIKFSNSMIEAFFKALKNNYFYFQKIRTKENMLRKLKFYVTQHNNYIPKQVLNGAIPIEAFKNQWTPEKITELEKQKTNPREVRKNTELSPTCKICK